MKLENIQQDKLFIIEEFELDEWDGYWRPGSIVTLKTRQLDRISEDGGTRIKMRALTFGILISLKTKTREALVLWSSSP